MNIASFAEFKRKKKKVTKFFTFPGGDLKPKSLNKTRSILVNARQTSCHILSIIDPNPGWQVIMGWT